MKGKTMRNLFSKVHDKVQEVTSVMVADVVDDMDQLTVALCAGNLGEIARVFGAKLGKSKETAAHSALVLGICPDIRNSAASKGFFAKGLSGLLDLAEANPDTGSRLMPIFNELVTDCKKYGIPKKLKARVKNYMSKKKDTDGFAIMGFNDYDRSTAVDLADWVFAGED